ncbi:MAG: hypothetical protein FJ320_07580 [SAR202 cluster bacterium]|nr:hypothetical protein [SAR202 cluster bacterium]
MKLDAITQFGANGTSALPATALTYVDKTFGYWTQYERVQPHTWPYISQVNNDYGATVSYVYAEIPNAPSSNLWSRITVSSKTISPGIGPSRTTTYTYNGGPSYNGDCIGSSEPLEYRGFQRVDEDDGTGVLVQHTYYTCGGLIQITHPLTGDVSWKNTNQLKGHEYDTYWRRSQQLYLKRQYTDWSSVTLSDSGSHRIYLDNAGTYTADGSNSKKRWTWYGYDSYNNQRWIKDYGDTSWVLGNDVNTGDEVTTWRAFAYNTTANILEKPYRERVYQGIKDSDDGTGNILSMNQFYYDGNNADGQLGASPSKGNLTRTQQFIKIDGSSSINTYHVYDSFGNLSEVTDPNGNKSFLDYQDNI